MSAIGRVAIITGGARGIGRAIAVKFLETGYRVALLDIDAATLARTTKELGNKDVLAVECDVARPEQVTASVNRIAAHFGRIDALVNNAGVAVFKPLLDTTFEEWSRVLDVNLSGPFLCTQACAPFML